MHGVHLFQIKILDLTLYPVETLDYKSKSKSHFVALAGYIKGKLHHWTLVAEIGIN